MGRVANGLAAGGVGTSLLNTVTYLDMALRGRPASPVPERDIETSGIPLGNDPEKVGARKEALGALGGYVAGFAGGVAFALVRPFARQVAWPLAAAATGVPIMVATDASSVAMGTTDPREWSFADWAADIVPHLAYGAGVVLTVDALED